MGGMPTWVPPEQRDTRWYIWSELFQVRISNIENMSLDYLKHFGMPAIGESQYDQATANELITTMIPIARMVDCFEKGVKVYISKPSDTKIIYDHIQAHLIAWKQKLEDGMNVRDAPIKDLMMMDKFANAIYEHAKYEFTEAHVDSIMARRMSGSLRLTRTKVLGNFTPQATTINQATKEEKEDSEKTKVEESKYPKRVSMAETFANSDVAGNHKRWR